MHVHGRNSDVTAEDNSGSTVAFKVDGTTRYHLHFVRIHIPRIKKKCYGCKHLLRMDEGTSNLRIIIIPLFLLNLAAFQYPSSTAFAIPIFYSATFSVVELFIQFLLIPRLCWTRGASPRPIYLMSRYVVLC